MLFLIGILDVSVRVRQVILRCSIFLERLSVMYNLCFFIFQISRQKGRTLNLEKVKEKISSQLHQLKPEMEEIT